MGPNRFGRMFLLSTLLIAGCSHRFELTKTTRIDGSTATLTSWQAQRLSDVENRLARELTQRTGWEWKSSPTLFQSSESPDNTIFFSKINKTVGAAFTIRVTPRSVVVEAAEMEGFEKAVVSLLGALVQENGTFFLPAGTIRPGS